MTPELCRIYAATAGYGYMIWTLMIIKCYYRMCETGISEKHKHLWLHSQNNDGEHLVFLPSVNRKYGCSTLWTTLTLPIEMIRNSTCIWRAKEIWHGSPFSYLIFLSLSWIYNVSVHKINASDTYILSIRVFTYLNICQLSAIAVCLFHLWRYKVLMYAY